ncbi:MAG: hypothetical protein ACREO8_10310 [Luteimonas sp.]
MSTSVLAQEPVSSPRDTGTPAPVIAPAVSASGFEWPLPAGWRKETIPFPVEFAPDIRHRGILELRFSPGFADPAAAGFWSYAFVWWLEDEAAPTRQQLTDELVRYYFGLSKLVAGDKYAVTIEQFRVDLKDDTAAPPYSAAFQGTIDSFDAFRTGKPIRLNVKLRVGACAAADRRFVLVEASPQPMLSSAEPWKALSQVGSSFTCAP